VDKSLDTALEPLSGLCCSGEVRIVGPEIIVGESCSSACTADVERESKRVSRGWFVQVHPTAAGYLRMASAFALSIAEAPPLPA
jgi:hypothetical protein